MTTTSTRTTLRRCCRKDDPQGDGVATTPAPRRAIRIRVNGWASDRTVDEMAHAWINIVYMKDEDFKIEQDKRRATPTTAAAAQQ